MIVLVSQLGRFVSARTMRLAGCGLCMLISSALWAADIPAFPGAAGGGAVSVGGRGGKVLMVTNLNDSGPGSLRAACAATGPRIVVFRVSGAIRLQKPLVITDPYITIAGQTAPTGGILLRGDGDNHTMFRLETHDIIIRYLRIRAGQSSARAGDQRGRGILISTRKTEDGKLVAGERIIVDHCSISWCADENITVWGWHDGAAPKDITFQYCISSEGFKGHSCGAIFGSENGEKTGVKMKNIDFHHNFLFMNNRRHPLVKVQRTQIINKICYGYKRYGVGIVWGVHADVIGNLLDGKKKHIVITETNPGKYNLPGKASILLHGNRIGNNEVANDDWEHFLTDLDPSMRRFERQGRLWPITITDVVELPDRLLPVVGASMRLDGRGDFVPSRCAVDKRILAEYSNRAGKIPANESEVGGFPEAQTTADLDLYPDKDEDGMSDVWERANQLSPDDESDARADSDGDGYTNIEEFLNGSDPHKK